MMMTIPRAAFGVFALLFTVATVDVSRARAQTAPQGGRRQAFALSSCRHSRQVNPQVNGLAFSCSA